MDGIITNLPEPFYRQTLEIWRDLEQRCGVGQVFITPVPHFSWQVVAEYEIQRVAEALAPLAKATRPFSVSTSGIGIFSQPKPIVYIPLVKDRHLLDFHRRLHAALKNAGRGDSPYYHPDFWMPHITLVFQDLTRQNVACVFERLAFESFNWKFTVDHLSVLRQEEGQPLVELLKLPLGEVR
jgi:2'-5' RNA ligase